MSKANWEKLAGIDKEILKIIRKFKTPTTRGIQQELANRGFTVSWEKVKSCLDELVEKKKIVGAKVGSYLIWQMR